MRLESCVLPTHKFNRGKSFLSFYWPAQLGAGRRSRPNDALLTRFYYVLYNQTGTAIEVFFEKLVGRWRVILTVCIYTRTRSLRGKHVAFWCKERGDNGIVVSSILTAYKFVIPKTKIRFEMSVIFVFTWEYLSFSYRTFVGMN